MTNNCRTRRNPSTKKRFTPINQRIMRTVFGKGTLTSAQILLFVPIRASRSLLLQLDDARQSSTWMVIQEHSSVHPQLTVRFNVTVRDLIVQSEFFLFTCLGGNGGIRGRCLGLGIFCWKGLPPEAHDYGGLRIGPWA